MANPLYNQYGNTPTNNVGISQLMKDAQRLRQTIQNPRKEVERLLQSGQMSQSDFNTLSKLANQILTNM